MTLPEAIDTTWIHRGAGLLGGRTAFVTTCPCRAPPHTLSDVGLIGGGPVPMPGEVFPALSHPTAAAERPLRCDNAVLPSLQV
jgi:predicted ATPase with chaperone activity